MDGYLGEIRLFAADFAPQGWAFCQGQVLQRALYSSLFDVIGNTYGGDGTSTFALPDYRGRAPIGFGSGASLSTYTLGQQTGNAGNLLNASHLPEHNHTITGSFSAMASSNAADQESPVGNYFATGDGTEKFDVQHDGVTMNYKNIMLNPTGNSDPVQNMMPYQAIHYIICIDGLFPTF